MYFTLLYFFFKKILIYRVLNIFESLIKQMNIIFIRNEYIKPVSSHGSRKAILLFIHEGIYTHYGFENKSCLDIDVCRTTYMS